MEPAIPAGADVVADVADDASLVDLPQAPHPNLTIPTSPPRSGGDGARGSNLNIHVESPGAKAKGQPMVGMTRANIDFKHPQTPNSTTDTNAIKLFLQQCRKGQALIGLWGGAAEKPCFHDLIYMAKNHPSARDFIQQCSNQLNTLLKSFKIMHWIDEPSDLPPDVYFCQSIVAWPITTLVQLTSWYVLCTDTLREWRYEAIRGSFHSFLTFGKGMLAAVAAASAANVNDYVTQALKVLRASFWVGFIFQENNDSIVPQIRSNRATFIMSISNIPLPVLEKIIEHCNRIPMDRNIKTYSTIEISRTLGPRSAFVCGHPLDLVRMERLVQNYQQKSGTKPSKAYQTFDRPINSHYFCQKLPREVVNAWRDDSIEFFADHLEVAVISPVTGENLRDADGLSAELAFSLTIHHHNLLKFLPVVPVHSNFIDFGPGCPRDLLSRTLMCQLLEHKLSAVLHPYMRTITGDILSPNLKKRSTKRVIRKSTFLKCAIINEILSMLGVPTSVEMSTWWLDLGLTKVASQDGMFQPSEQRALHAPPASPKFDKRRSEMFAKENWEVVVDEQTGEIKVLTSDKAAEELEQRTSVTLTALAVKFTETLSDTINRQLPPTLLIMCPTVASVMEVWDVYDLLDLRRVFPHRPMGAKAISDLYPHPQSNPSTNGQKHLAVPGRSRRTLKSL
eukprot:TRINITY_DN2202_c1_g2_i1.p1 TRINITY_DN2202_c1_g2~~TRINITY_DN2202_c1_g2_i1.p1  ORF type:complete len:711 (+),score=215.23 TRINITY_DN2202_c1_g2_i1:104-2134(+)